MILIQLLVQSNQELDLLLSFRSLAEPTGGNRANVASPHTIVAPLTSRIRKSILSSHVFIPIGVANLTQDSVILCEQIRVIDKSRIIRVIGHLDNEHIMQLNMALRTILGLSDNDVFQIITEE